MSTPNVSPQPKDAAQHHAQASADDHPTTPDSTTSSASSSTSTSASIRPAPAQQQHLTTCLSHSHDAPLTAYTSHVSIDDRIYDRLPARRKLVIVALISYCSFLAPISSTTVLSAVPEVAQEFQTSGSVINISNALYMLFMGVSPCFWGPMSQIYGRRWVGALFFFFNLFVGFFACVLLLGCLTLQMLVSSCVRSPEVRVGNGWSLGLECERQRILVIGH